jgi:3-hydroxyacyl-CoA dehydrogenase
VHALVRQGKLGDKTGGGFYQKTKEGVLTYDWRNGEYVPQQRSSGDDRRSSFVCRCRAPAGIKSLTGAHGAFLRDHLVDAAHYALTLAPTLAHDLVAIDRAMVWGYGWESVRSR